MKVVIAGGSGFIGHALIKHFQDLGYEAVVLSRSPSTDPVARIVAWDGETVGEWAKELEGAKAVINLSGESIVKHWSKEAKARILTSRVQSTRAIGQAIPQCAAKPDVWINASAIGYYGDRGGEELTEDSKPGPRGHFLVDTCVAWEQMVHESEVGSTRKVILRTGIVLGRGGGTFEPLYKLTKFFLGGHHGNGSQFMSWLHLEDLVRLFEHCAEHPIEGVVNATAPNPVTNQFLMASLRAVVGRPWSPPVPAFALKLVSMIGGPEASLLLEGQRVLPKRALQEGFAFKYTEVTDALRQLVKTGS